MILLQKTGSSPTMVDVAREAGVSLGTVSKVVNHQPVGEAFRKKVEEAIDRLGYQYNSSGKALRTDRTNTIALIIPNTVNPYFALLVNEVEAALEKRGRRLLLCFTDYDQKKEEEFILMARQSRADGVIAMTYHPDLKIPEDIPFVTIDRFFSVSVPCIASDNFGGGYLAARKLKELGCEKVAFLRFSSPLVNEPSKRKDGFVSGCVELGLSFEIKALQDGDSFSEIEDFLSDHIRDGRMTLDGLFVGTDMLAWQIIRYLRKKGVRVPEDLQVIGFDGIRMFGDQDLIVSTIVQPVAEIAEAAVNTVLSSHLSGMPSLICLPVTYAAGGTTRE